MGNRKKGKRIKGKRVSSRKKGNGKREIQLVLITNLCNKTNKEDVCQQDNLSVMLISRFAVGCWIDGVEFITNYH